MNTNPNPTNASTETVNGFPKVTTQTLGIATERGRDLAGYLLGPDEISTAVTKFFMFYGIDESDIYAVKVGSDKDGLPKIFAEIAQKALSGRKKKNDDWMTFDSYDNDNQLIPDKFYSAWNNKIYHGKRKHLHVKTIYRNGGDKYVSIEIDPMIFIAFAYDIEYTDHMYKLSAPAKRWPNQKKIDDMSGKERKKLNAKKQEYSTYSMGPCRFVAATFSNDNGGFHPDQVDKYHNDANQK